MPKLGYGYAHYSGSPSSLPSDISGLKLWLKADAGVKFGSFIKEIVVSGAGTSSVNGVYSRQDPSVDQFNGPNGNRIYWLGSYWILNNESLGLDYYINYSYFFEDVWYVQPGGVEPIPNFLYNGFPASTNTITLWEDQSGNKNHFTGRNAQLLSGHINGKPAVYINPSLRSSLSSPTTLFDGLTALSFIAVCDVRNTISGEAYFSGAIGITDLDPGIHAFIGTNFIIGDGINFFQTYANHINYLDATTGNGSAFQDSQQAVAPFISQIIISGAGETSSNGTYTRASGGTTAFNGPNGNIITWTGAEWNLYDSTYGDSTYFIPSFSFDSDWYETYGSAPAPTGAYTTSYESAVNASGVVMPLASGTSLVMGNNTMYLAELIIYNKRLSTTERKQVEGYLNFKYAIY